ncbi:MAG: 50S ribosomal protein L6 [archaeon]|nr:50S ribosomal protein L6 [archaeon]
MVYERNITIPEGVKLERKDGSLSVSGEKGASERVFIYPHVMLVVSADAVKVSTESKRKKDRAVVGTWTSHINNMIKGVKEGYEYKLKIVYSHFPMSVVVKDAVVEIKNYLGSKDLRFSKVVGDTKVNVKKEDIVVSGVNKEDVGQTSANLEKSCIPKNKDRRCFQDGIYLVARD